MKYLILIVTSSILLTSCGQSNTDTLSGNIKSQDTQSTGTLTGAYPGNSLSPQSSTGGR